MLLFSLKEFQINDLTRFCQHVWFSIIEKWFLCQYFDVENNFLFIDESNKVIFI